MRVGAVANIGCGLLLALAGCGQHVTAPREIASAKVSAMAERELEAQNPGMAPGTLVCPDLAFRLGASVRCVRTVELSGGRVVRVRGTVEVTSLSSGGRLHVAMDDRAEEFGLTGAQVAGELRRRYARRAGVQPGEVECPYLRGAVGSAVTCRLELDGSWHRLEVVVTAVDPEGYRTDFRYRAHHPVTS